MASRSCASGEVGSGVQDAAGVGEAPCAGGVEHDEEATPPQQLQAAPAGAPASNAREGGAVAPGEVAGGQMGVGTGGVPAARVGVCVCAEGEKTKGGGTDAPGLGMAAAASPAL